MAGSFTFMPETSTPPLICAEALGKRYGARHAVANLSMRLSAGTVLGFVGANGGGKTTSMRMLAGLLRPDSGQAQVLGHDIARDAAAVRGAVGYLSQRLSLYAELSVRQNLRFRAGLYLLPNARSRIDAALERFALTAHANDAAGTLSGGWARRLQLAAVTLHEPPLLLLDEPTAGLDARHRAQFWTWIGARAADGGGVIIATHDLREAERCDQIIYFLPGRLVGPHPPAQLIRDLGVADLEAASLHLTNGGSR